MHPNGLGTIAARDIYGVRENDVNVAAAAAAAAIG